MQQIKKNWDITSNWQLIYLLLGMVALWLCGYLLSTMIVSNLYTRSDYQEIIKHVIAISIAYALYRLCMIIFKRLIPKWDITNRWEMVAIFIVFAITGSASARLSSPLLSILGIDANSLSNWLYWPLRLIIIFPIYQVLLVLMGWLFGQFQFFWKFEKKMLSRFGIKL